MKNYLLLTLLVLCASCTSTPSIRIDGGAFVDNMGREVVFNGINHVHKVRTDNYLNARDSSIFRMYERDGFNFIRLGVYWRAVEPTEGKYDEAYLLELDRRVSWARDCGLWVMIDLHQDLYIEAAPEWAVLSEGKEHITGEVWSDSYMISPAVQTAFDNFWIDRKTADSVGVQTRYVDMLGMLAKRYKDSSAVVGYDVMNEPFMGSSATQIMPLMLQSYAKAVGSDLSIEELGAQWSSTEGRLKLMDELNNKQLFAQIADGMAPLVDTFERGDLSAFYQRAADAVRGAGSSQILFLEHSYFCNIGISSTFAVPVDADGARDPQCAYAPHGYDLVTDTHADSMQGTERVDFIFERIFQSAADRNMPVVVGEWGAFYGGADDYSTPARHIVELVEKANAGQAYWCYWPGVENNNYYQKVLARTYPMATNGRLVDYRNNFDNSTFTMEWKEDDSDAPTIVFLSSAVDASNIGITPQSDYTITDSKLYIKPIGNSLRTLTISL